MIGFIFFQVHNQITNACHRVLQIAKIKRLYFGNMNWTCLSIMLLFCYSYTMLQTLIIRCFSVRGLSGLLVHAFVEFWYKPQWRCEPEPASFAPLAQLGTCTRLRRSMQSSLPMIVTNWPINLKPTMPCLSPSQGGLNPLDTTDLMPFSIIIIYIIWPNRK